ncbi:unnamed protein product [Urochloa humidicola]
MAEMTGPSWSDIPLDLTGRILRRLPAHIDRIRFAAVCPEWRAAARQVPVHPPLPLHLLPDATAYSLPGSKPFHIADCTGYSDACGNWLVFSREDACFLKDSFSKATVTLAALSRFQVQHVDHEFLDEEMDEIEEVDACKMIFCSPQLIAAILDCVDTTSIAVCPPGANSWWSVLVDHHIQAPLFVDIVFYQGSLYALDSRDRLFTVHISTDQSTGDPRVSQIQQVIGGLPVTTSGLLNLKMSYLVESCSALLVVCRKRRIDIPSRPGQRDIIGLAAEQDRFEVFEANFEQSRWDKVTTLGDNRVLFLRRRCCRSLCVSHDEVPGDCIFFLENDYEDHYSFRKGPSSSCGVYSMRGDKVSTPLPTVSWDQDMVFAT